MSPWGIAFAGVAAWCVIGGFAPVVRGWLLARRMNCALTVKQVTALALRRIPIEDFITAYSELLRARKQERWLGVDPHSLETLHAAGFSMGETVTDWIRLRRGNSSSVGFKEFALSVGSGGGRMLVLEKGRSMLWAT